MKHFALPALAAILAGCATPAYVSPVEVTRFVGATPSNLAMGTVEIMSAPAREGGEGDGRSLEFGIYADAIRAELESLGYRAVAQNGGQVAEVDVEYYVVENDGRRRGGVGVGAGGSTGSYGSGIGVGVGIDLSSLINGPPPERIERQVSVAIRDRNGGANLWEGRATMTATSNSDFANEPAAAARMARALFENFPGVSGETVEVD